MGFLRLFLLLSCWVGVGSAALAQGRLTGVLQDSATHEPLAFASVFLANTTLGATTTEQGKFVLERVPKGTYELMGSYVGYRLAKQSVTVVAGATQQVTLRLASSGPQLEEVVVQANPHQEDDYRKFVDLFLGHTSFSKQCRITNPEEVDVAYNDKTKDLIATADNFLQVENQALGYRLKYFGLRFQYNTEDESVSFDGQPIFEEMTARDDQQRRQWEANRATAYHGSLTHFLKSVYDNRVQEEGFLAQKVRIVENPRLVLTERLRKQGKRPTAAEQDSLRKWSRLPDVVARLFPAARPIDSLRRISGDGAHTYLRFTNELQVCHFGEAPDPKYDQPMASIGPAVPGASAKREVSRLSLLADEVEIQPNGALVSPLVGTGDYWGFEKIGELLPLDYAPPATAALATPSKS